MVVGADLGIASPRKDRQDFSATSLEEEAGPGITRTDLLQSLAAHFLAHLNTWQDEGFRPVHDHWLFRAEGRQAPIEIAHGEFGIEGQVLGLDESAGLLVRTKDGKVRSLAFIDSVRPGRALNAALSPSDQGHGADRFYLRGPEPVTGLPKTIEPPLRGARPIRLFRWRQ